MQLVVYSKEDLPDPYRDCVSDGDSLSFFHHRFLVQMMPLALPDTLENVVQARTERAHRFLEAGQLDLYIHAHERGYRFDALFELMHSHSWNSLRKSVEFWALARYVWTDSEMPEDANEWRDLIECGIPNREAMTESADRKTLRRMCAAGETLTVYRGGCIPRGADPLEALSHGFQWSRSLETASFFARRFKRRGERPAVLKLEVSPEGVIAYLTNRGEEEVLLDPWDVNWWQAEEVSDLPPTRNM